MPTEMNLINRFSISDRKDRHMGLALRVNPDYDMIDRDMVADVVVFNTPNGNSMEAPIDKVFGFVDSDGSYSMIFFFDGLNGAYNPVGFKSPDDIDDDFNFPPIVA